MAAGPARIWGYRTSPPIVSARTVATLIDDAGLSARIGADQLGHAQVSMTQDRYMSRGRVHHQVADLLEQTVSDETEALNAD
jgi:integrase